MDRKAKQKGRARLLRPQSARNHKLKSLRGLLVALGMLVGLTQGYSQQSEGRAGEHEGTANGEQDDLSQRVRQEVLDQLNPVRVGVSTRGITTLQFPVNIEAVDGDGIQAESGQGSNQSGQQGNAQFSVSAGPNWVSVKALREGVEQNLNVMLRGLVYPIVLSYAEQNEYSVLFSFKRSPAIPGAPTSTAQAHPKTKQISTARLLGLLDKLKGYPTFSKVQPAMYIGLDISEPNAPGKWSDDTEHLHSQIKRVVRDDALDAIGFEVELFNKTAQTIYYDPEGFAVRVGQEVYQEAISDAAGKIDPNVKQTVYFVVAGSGESGHRNDLSVYNDFSTVIREMKVKG